MSGTEGSAERPPRLCLIVTSEVSALAFYPGYLSFLRRHGWDVTIVADSSGRLEALAEAEGVRAVAVPMRRDPAPLRDVLALLRLSRVLRSLRPDVVVTATPKAGLLGMVAGRLSGVPGRIHQVWGLRFETERGLRRTVFVALERLSAAAATRVLANSPSLARAALSEGIARRTGIDVLGSGSATGIDVARFSPDSPMGVVDQATREFVDEHPQSLVVGFVGRLNRDKGVPTLLDAAAACVATGVDLRLIIVGRSESPDLERLVQDAAARIPIHRVDAVDDPRPYFLAFDVNCLPTLREGLPTVVLEAAALGVPTITTTATGAVDSVVDGVTGLLVPPSDPFALAAALTRCAQDRTMLRRFAEDGRRRVEREFSSTRVWGLLEADFRAEFIRGAAGARSLGRAVRGPA